MERHHKTSSGNVPYTDEENAVQDAAELQYNSGEEVDKRHNARIDANRRNAMPDMHEQLDAVWDVISELINSGAVLSGKASSILARIQTAKDNNPR